MDKNILAQIRNDVQMNGDLEGLGLEQDRRDDFWEWFVNQAVELKTTSFDGSKLLTDRIKQNRCFGNSQFLALDMDLNYYEGFMDLHGRFIHHGFNGIVSGVFDSTVERFPHHFLIFMVTNRSSIMGCEYRWKF